MGAHFGVVLVIDEVEGRALRPRSPPSARMASTLTAAGPIPWRFQNPAEDVLRRDFTVNGLLLDALRFEAARPESCVLDFVDGRADLAARLIRAIGDPCARFTEDKLRMLRAVRFAARLGFTIEPAPCAPFSTAHAEVEGCLRERIRDELTKILTEGLPRRALSCWTRAACSPVLLPEVARMKGASSLRSTTLKATSGFIR